MLKKRKVEARCRHTGADGRRCTMSPAPGGDSLCLPHRQRQQKESDAQALAAELLGPFREFKTATAVNHALGKLFSLVARGRIAPRNAAVLAYIGQLLLNSLSAVRREAQLTRGYDKWHSLLRRTLRDAQREATLAGQDAQVELERAAEHSPPRRVEVKIVRAGTADAAGTPG